MRLVFHWATIVLGLYLISLIPPLGISYDKASSLLWAGLVMWLLNAILKPILVILTLPLLLVTLGLFLLVINAILLDWLPVFVHGYHVPGFWSAFFGAILLSLITGFFGGWDKRSRRVVVRTHQPRGRVVDI